MTVVQIRVIRVICGLFIAPQEETMFKRLVAVLAAVGMSAATYPSLQAQARTVITGIVKNASGEPVAGALVRLRNREKGLTFLVVSQALGRYTTSSILPGKYTIEGIGGNFQQGEPTA